MKPKLEPLSRLSGNVSFICYEVVVPVFSFFWHYHPEYELTCIVAGKGKRLIGNGYEHFQEGDWVLLPPMLPHTWVSEHQTESPCRAIVIQFSQAFMEQLLRFPELHPLQKLFAKADRGLHFPSPTPDDAGLMEEILRQEDSGRFPLLIQLLNRLSARLSVPVASQPYKPLKGSENQQRINKVFQYVQAEFNQGISVKAAAALISLSESAFCKFFKRASGKTFSDYTNDIRIAHACHLLLETDKPISEVAFDAGFESLTYFNRVFRKKKQLRPGEYRRIFHK